MTQLALLLALACPEAFAQAPSSLTPAPRADSGYCQQNPHSYWCFCRNQDSEAQRQCIAEHSSVRMPNGAPILR